MADNRVLNIVDENSMVVGKETRERIHKEGLLHREINVWFYTPRGELIFQHRAKDKDMYPDLLDATVGGHVEIGSDYEATALQEIEEETGIRVGKGQLAPVQTLRKRDLDAATGNINNTIKAVYAYRYDGKPEDLRVERGEAVGFETWPLEVMFHLSDAEKRRFIPLHLEPDTLAIFHKVEQLVRGK